MTRRIVLAILALICALLATVAVPLGLITAAHDRQDYRDQAAATARSLAGVAEEKLADHERGAALARTITQIRGRGDQVGIYDHAGHRARPDGLHRARSLRRSAARAH